MASAVQVQLQAQQGPYYVAVPIQLQVIAEGFEETPQPEIEVEPPRHGRLALTGVSPNVSTSIQIINNQMIQSKQVQFVFHYQFLAETPGHYTLGPFRVRQGGTQGTTRTAPLTVGDVPRADNQQLRLILPKGPLIVGQRVPVRIEWWTPLDLQGQLFNARLRVPLFEQLNAFRFHDAPAPDADVALTIDTSSGPIELPATTSRENRDGKRFLVRTLTREMIPLQAGIFELAPATLVVDQAIRWRRTLFGDRVATHARKQQVTDTTRSLRVRELPTTGRPASFTGTVGHGYTLEVAADRSVVRVGDPIRLTVILRGDAAVETAVLPPLSADGGLSPEDFRLPQEKSAGVYQAGSKRFEVSVRVLHAGVTEIPPLAFSWYDPEQQSYQTTHSQPIALSVRAAQVVSAGDVVRGQASESQTPEPTAGSSEQEATTSEPGTRPQQRPAFTLTGADLAITTAVDKLLRPESGLFTSLVAQATAYGLGILAIFIALLTRRRAAADPAEVARTKSLRDQRRTIAQTRDLSTASAALRRMIALSGERPSTALDAFLAECDAYAFAPGEGARQLDTDLHTRALALADHILKGT